jgi:hypothetical protein
MPSFQLAADQGRMPSSWTQLTADGAPVVLHDDTLDRTTDRTGPVGGVLLADLRGADAGARFTRDGGRTFLPRHRCADSDLGEVLWTFPDAAAGRDQASPGAGGGPPGAAAGGRVVGRGGRGGPRGSGAVPGAAVRLRGLGAGDLATLLGGDARRRPPRPRYRALSVPEATAGFRCPPGGSSRRRERWDVRCTCGRSTTRPRPGGTGSGGRRGW